MTCDSSSANSATNILYFPIVYTENQLIDLISRAAWFLSFCSVDHIFIMVNSDQLKNTEWRVSAGMDGSIVSMLGELRQKVVFVLAKEKQDIYRLIENATFILHWQKDTIPDLLTKECIDEWEKGKKVLQVDPVGIRQEGGFYIDVSYTLMKNRTAIIDENKLKFAELSKRLGKYKRAFVMATGPSVSNYKYLDFDNSLSVVCNSVILDEDLMETVRPQILVFADPIFHFGPSQYAGIFRKKLAESAKKYDFTICIPLKYYPLFTSAMPELVNRTIGIPFIKDRLWNFDLESEFVLKTTANVLTFLMIPIATTFADEISFLGCNGRPLNENSYFWNHNSNTQINDKMANIREIHPGFFNIDYNDYYQEHCETLRQQLLAGEQYGKTFLSLGFSYIPALNSRLSRGTRINASRLDPKQTTAILIVPNEETGDKTLSKELQAALNSLGTFTYVIRYSSNDFTSTAHQIDITVSEIDAVNNNNILLYCHHLPVRSAKELQQLVASYSNVYLHLRFKSVLDEMDADQIILENVFFDWLANSGPRSNATVITNDEMSKLGELTGCLFQTEMKIPSAQDETIRANAWVSFADSLLGTSGKPEGYPKILVVDLTNMGGVAATSRVKEVFFGGWPEEKFRIVCQEGGINKHLVFADKSGKILISESNQNEIMGALLDYAPQVLYYRAVDSQLVHDFAFNLTNLLPIPHIIHLMDDWPARLCASKPDEYAYFDNTLRKMLGTAASCLSISNKMSAAFEERYGVNFVAYANAVDPSSFPPKILKHDNTSPFIIRYTGALAADMTLASITDFAEAVELLAEELNVKLEIFTRQPWKSQALQQFARMKAVSVHDQVPIEKYNLLLQEADALLIAYNFDDASQTYIGYSMANKLPEYLASSTPVIVYGPPDCATIAYTIERNIAQIIDCQNQSLILSKIRELVTNPDLQIELGARGKDTVLLKHNIWKIAGEFRKLIMNAVNGLPKEFVGPYSRDNAARWDETDCVAELFTSTLTGTTMIDVGGHHGSALMPFLNKAWRIFAFEPDKKNREKLIERLAKHKNKDLVNLDTHAVSNKSQTGLSYYRSEVSTGISGLSAFHDSHEETHQVDTITLTDFFADKELPYIDFLKIDTEGHDLFVLKGFPWERCKPAVIECEFEDLKTVPLGYTYYDLADYLVNKGYTVYTSEWHPIVRYGISHDWNRLVRYPCTLANEQGWGNLLAFREPIDEKVLIEAVHKVLKVGSNDSKNPAVLQSNLSDTPSTSLAVSKSQPKATESSATVQYVKKTNALIQFTQVLPGKYFIPVSDNTWRYNNSDVSAQKLWIVAFDVACTTVDRTFVAGIHLLSNKHLKVQVSLGRHGKTDYEGASKRITLLPGIEQNIRLIKMFSKQHSALKVQVEFLELIDGTEADLTIDSIYIAESLTSARKRTTENELKLSVANRLFREHDYSKAMGIYLWLHEQRQLNIYSDNALMCARKLGLREVQALDELLRLLTL